MRKGALLVGLVVALASCVRAPSGPCCVETSSYRKAQPFVVSLLPVMGGVDSSLSWDLKEEVTDQIGKALVEQEGWQLASSEDALWQAALLGEAPRFSPDLSYFSPLHGSSDFIVVAELVDHHEEPYKGQKIHPLYVKDGEIDSVLMMKLRVRVVDLRAAQPRLVLQEVVHSNHMIRKREHLFDYQAHGWGSGDYQESALGVAHRRLAEEVAAHIDRYASLPR